MTNTTSRELEKEVRGLVLAGGGAKGAYAFGCLRVFRKHGIPFHAVSGTSVGALNAVIWSTGRMDLGGDLWRNLEQQNVYPTRRLACLASPFLIPSKLAAAFADGSLSGNLLWLDKLGARAFTVVALCCFLPFLYSTILRDTSSVTLAVLVDAIALTSIVMGASRPWFRQLFAMGCGIIAVCFLWALVSRLFGSQLVVHNSSAEHLLATIAFLVLVAILASRVRYAAVRVEPLRDSISRVLDGASLEIPTYVTTGQKVPFYDPDDEHFYELRSWPAPTRTMREHRAAFFPEYHLLNRFGNHEQVELLLASAALPFGLVLPMRNRGRELVDGGVVDNVPIYPLVEYERCTELVVVDLDAREKPDAADHYRKVWQMARRLLRIRQIPVPNTTPQFAISRRNEPPTNVPFEEPSHWPRRIITCRLLWLPSSSVDHAALL